MIEDGANLGQSGYAAEKAAAKQATKDRALLDKLSKEYNIATCKAAIAAITPERMHDLALEYFDGLTSEQQDKAGRFDAGRMKFADRSTTINFCNVWLARRVKASFEQAAFDAYVRAQGHDPEALRASAARLPPEEQGV